MDDLILEQEDYKMLFEALDALAESRTSSILAMGLLAMGLSDSQEEARERSHELHQQLDENRRGGVILQERIVLLKAKLIRMRDRAIAQQVSDGLGLTGES